MQLPSWLHGKVFKISMTCAIAAYGLATANSYAASEGKVTISFNLQNAAVTLHEPVYLELSVQNELQEPIQIDLGFNRKSKFSFEIREPAGSVVHLAAPAAEGLGRIGRLSIGPGSTYKQRLLLNEWYQFPAAGKYMVLPELDGDIKTSSGTAVKRSAPRAISLEVLPRNEERLRKVCAELAQQTVSSSSVEDILAAALALSYVSDPVAVAYLGKVLEQSAVGRNLAITGLQHIAGAEAAGVLIANLKQLRDQETSATIVFALQQISATTQDPKVKNLIATGLREAGR